MHPSQFIHVAARRTTGLQTIPKPTDDRCEDSVVCYFLKSENFNNKDQVISGFEETYRTKMSEDEKNKFKSQLKPIPLNKNDDDCSGWIYPDGYSDLVDNNDGFNPSLYAQNDVWKKGMNNAYNHACGLLTHTAASPGRATCTDWTPKGDQSQSLAERTILAATEDKLIPLDSLKLEDALNELASKGPDYHLAALLVADSPESRDFFSGCHWIRRHADKTWSQKFNSDMPTNFDFAGNYITDDNFSQSNWVGGMIQYADIFPPLPARKSQGPMKPFHPEYVLTKFFLVNPKDIQII